MSEALIIYPQNTLHKVLETQIDVSRPIQNDTLLFWILRYLEQKVAGIQSRHTLEAKGRDLFGFARWFTVFNGHELIADWRPRDTQAYLSHLEKQGRAATTINRVFASMRRFARWTHEQADSPLRYGLPTQDIKELTVDEPDCKKLSARELHRLFKAADNLVLTDTRKNARPRRNRAILALLYYSGLRVSELTMLELSQYRDKYLHEVKRKGKSRSKGLYLSSSCRVHLDDYLETERCRDDENNQMIPLFLSVAGEKFLARQQVSAILKHIADEANKHSKDKPIEIHPHRLRHTFGAEFRERTGSDTETQQALGHVSLKYVGRYVRKTQQEREETLEEIGRQF
jgi:site-specific recombinase XerD